MTERPKAVTALLAPWLDHARRHMYGALDDLPDPADLVDDLWIAWRLTARADALGEWVRTLETLELLDLFVRVDYKAGWTWILETLGMPQSVALLDALPAPIFPRHSVCCQAPMENDSFARAEMLVLTLRDERHSPDFHRVRSELMRRWEREERASGERIRVSLDVDLEGLDDELGAVNALRALAELATLAHDPARYQLLDQLSATGEHSGQRNVSHATTTRPSDVFVLQRVEINAGDVTFTDPMLASLGVIQRCGVHISAINLEQTGPTPDLITLQATIEFLRTVVVPEAPTRMVTISRPMVPFVFDAFWSALATTRSVDDVSVPWVPSHAWSWIAYALFSGDVDNQIVYVNLGVQELTREDVATIRRIVQARDPLATLVSKGVTGGAPVAGERVVVDVRPNSVGLYRFENPRAQPISVWIDELGSTDLRVVDELLSSTHISVLYPGAGVCWIRREDVVARRHLPPRDTTLRPRLRRISFELGPDTSLTTLVELIQLVGPLTRILLLHSPNGSRLPDSVLRDALAACPELERLDISMARLAGFAWLSGNESTRIRAMRLMNVSCDDPHGYAPLFETLRDSHTGAGRSLRELAISTDLATVRRSWSALDRMLTTNHQLQRVCVRANDHEGGEVFETLVRDFDSHHGDPLHVQEKPLPSRSRVALISVFAHRSDLRELDAAMLAIVFAFASPNKKRQCVLAGKVVRPRG